MIDPGRLKTRPRGAASRRDARRAGRRDARVESFATVWAQVRARARARHDVAADADGATLSWRIVLRTGLSLTLQAIASATARASIASPAIRDSDDGRLVEIDAETRQWERAQSFIVIPGAKRASRN